MPKAVAVAVIWTSTLQRTILTAGSIVGFPKVGARKMSYFLVKVARGKYGTHLDMNDWIVDGLVFEKLPGIAAMIDFLQPKYVVAK
ncbi:hypothetical protein CsSME_00012728 [Camellia sinensis var. sinensis]